MRTSVFLIACLIMSVGVSRSARADGLEAGVAVVEITPPKGYRMAGYYAERLNTGTHDPLNAKAVVFRQGDRRAALVFCDLVGIPAEVSRRARERAEKATGIPAVQIAVAATHSHTGPLYYGIMRTRFHTKAIAEHGRDLLEAIDYAEWLAERVSEAIAKAQAALAPVRLAAGVAQETRISFNRRFHMKDGTVRFNPGALNPEIVRPAGPIDPDVGIVMLYPPEGKSPIAGLTVFALHLDTVGGTEYSADYPNYLETDLRRAFGPKYVSLFGAGTCGDINHIDVKTKERAKTEAIAARLAETVRTAEPGLEPLTTPALAATSKLVRVPLQQYPDDEVADARSKQDRLGDAKLPFLDRVKAAKILDLQEHYPGKTVDLLVQAFRLGPELAIVTLPGEVFVEHGLAIKRASPFKTTLVVELANANPAYIPTRKAFIEGSYEIVNSRLAPGGGEQLVEAAVLLLKELDK
jgi:hypothetical protein